MGLDTGIFNMLGRGVKSVADYDNERSQGEMNQLNLLSAREDMAGKQRATRNALALEDAYKGFGADPTQNANLLYQRGQGGAAQGYLKAVAELDGERAKTSGLRATAGKTEADADKVRLEAAIAKQAQIAQAARTATDQASWDRGLALVRSLGVDVSNIPTQFDPAFAQQVATQAMTGTQQLEQEWKVKDYGLRSANEFMTPDGLGGFVPNQPLIAAKAGVARAGAASGPVTYSSPTPMQVGASGDVVMVQSPNRPGAPAQVMRDPATNEPLRPAPPQKAGGALSPTAQKELFEADDTVQSGRAVVNILRDALKINSTAYSGYGAKTRAIVRSNVPGVANDPAADATINLDNMMTGQALESLKLTFGGMPTEGERKILLDIQASADKTPTQRKDIIERAIRAANTRIAFNEKKAQSLRDGTYMTQGIAQSGVPQDSPTPPVARTPMAPGRQPPAAASPDLDAALKQYLK